MTEKKEVLAAYDAIYKLLSALVDATGALAEKHEGAKPVDEAALALLNTVEGFYSRTSTDYPGGLEDWAEEYEEEEADYSDMLYEEWRDERLAAGRG